MSLLKIYTDGGSRGNPGVAGIGVHVEDESGETIYEQAKFLGTFTNNESEYQGLQTALEWLLTQLDSQKIAVDEVHIFMDSKLVVEQINRNWQIKQDHLQQLANQIWELLGKISTHQVKYSLQHVRREFNKRADELANQAMDAGAN